MSDEGVKSVADIFSQMQSLRFELLRRASIKAGLPSAHQDALLAQMLEKGKNAMQDDFAKIAGLDLSDKKKRKVS